MTQIAFTGDIAFTKYFQNSCNDDKLLSEKIVNFFTETDFTVVNVEGAVSSLPISVAKDLTHANPPESIKWFEKINGKIWNIANNHSMDCGVEGLKSTLDIAQKNNFTTIGAGMDIIDARKPFIIDENGGIGIVSVTYFRNNKADINSPGCFVAEDEEIVKEQIKEIKRKCRWCIVISHVGQEFSQMPMPFVRERYKRYLKYGADIIIGHHPHVVQNYEKIGDKIIFYSLGNFIFDTEYQRIQKYTDFGMLVKIKFDNNTYDWDFMPTKIDRETQRISVCNTPDIFCNINSFQYNLLWPLAAKHLSLNIWKKKSFHNPELKKRSWLDWFLKHDIKMCKKVLGRNIVLGRFLSVFCFWKFANKSIVEYIKER